MQRDQRTDLKLLHTADIHLGDGVDSRLERAAFAAVIDSAIAQNVDIMVIAGDLFDSNRAPKENVDFVLGQLARLDIPIVILPGNHDSYDENSVYRRVAFEEQCPKVKLIAQTEGELLYFSQLGLTLWGKPVIEHHPGFHPISDLPPRRGRHWHVGVAHGHHVPDGQSTERSSPICSHEIASSGWDYIALGHVHPFRDVSEGDVMACYSGTPVRTNPHQQGAGSVVIVHLDDEQGVRLERVLVSSI